jgi:DNA topoisomerase VI subunit A
MRQGTCRDSSSSSNVANLDAADHHDETNADDHNHDPYDDHEDNLRSGTHHQHHDDDDDDDDYDDDDDVWETRRRRRTITCSVPVVSSTPGNWIRSIPSSSSSSSSSFPSPSPQYNDSESRSSSSCSSSSMMNSTRSIISSSRPLVVVADRSTTNTSSINDHDWHNYDRNNDEDQDDDDNDDDNDDSDSSSSITISPATVIERIEELVLRSFMDPLCSDITSNQNRSQLLLVPNHDGITKDAHKRKNPRHDDHNFGGSSSSSSSSLSSVISKRRRRKKRSLNQCHAEDNDANDDHFDGDSKYCGPIVPYIDPYGTARRKISFLTNQQSRTMTSIFLVASFCHELLVSGTISTDQIDCQSDADACAAADGGGRNYFSNTISDHNDDDQNVAVSDNLTLRRGSLASSSTSSLPGGGDGMGVATNTAAAPPPPTTTTGTATTTTTTIPPMTTLRTATTREVYYHFVTHFKNQRECDRAIWDLTTLLHASRQSLGLVASPKGWFCGCIRFYNKGTNNLMWDGRELDIHGMPITASTYSNSQTMANITIESDAKCILVIEKEGVYTRLSEDKFFLHYYPSILVTGKGFPDIATRRWVQKLQSMLQIPVFGLCDCNPYGVSVLNSYQYGDNQGGGGGGTNGIGGMSTQRSIRTTPSRRCHRQPRRKKAFKSNSSRSIGGGSRCSRAAGQNKLQLQWIGLRPSQVDELDLPDTAFQEMTAGDRRQLKSLLHESHPFQQQGWNCELRRAELEQMDRYKVELEALNWKGMDFMCKFVHRIIQAHESYHPSKLDSNNRRRRHHHNKNDSQTTSEDETSSTDEEESLIDISPYII